MEETIAKKPQSKKKKIIGASVLALGVVVLLASCTKSFCSDTDYAHIMRAYEPGVVTFFDEATTVVGEETVSTIPFSEDTGLYFLATKNETIKKIDSQMETLGSYVPKLDYWVEIDRLNFEEAFSAYSAKVTADGGEAISKANLKAEDATTILSEFGHLKYLSASDAESVVLWDNFESWTSKLAIKLGTTAVPTTVYREAYKTELNNFVNANRSCIAIETGKYGHYIPTGSAIEAGKVEIEGKGWGYAWKKGFLEGLIVYPVAFMIEKFSEAFGANGWGQIWAIVLVTVIVRLLLQTLTFWATRSQIKMQALQPEIDKLQEKYPNSAENQQEKQRMATEQQALYKKHKVRMWMPFAQMIIQFPIFISVWGAMTGSASLSSDTVLGIRLSGQLSGMIFNGGVLGTGAWWAALGLFLVMAATQVLSIILPQILTKVRAKRRLNKLGPQPQAAKKKSGNMMMIVMGVMTIVMGLFLPSAMAVYWIVGAVVTTAVTVVTHFLTIRATDNLGKKPPQKGKKNSKKAKNA